MTAERGDAKKGAVMQSLIGMDAAFLALETPTTPMHVGVALVLDPPEGTRSLFSPSTRYAQIRRVIQQRLHLIPPLRQRALRVPFGLHHPVWVEDPDFDIIHHVRTAARLVVQDQDGAVVIPKAFLDLILAEGAEQERMEAWIVEQVNGGAVLPGLYPMNAETKARYAASKK